MKIKNLVILYNKYREKKLKKRKSYQNIENQNKEIKTVEACQKKIKEMKSDFDFLIFNTSLQELKDITIDKKMSTFIFYDKIDF